MKLFYIMFLLLYSGFLLFDYYPDQVVKSTVINTEHIKVTITELLVIIIVFIYLVDEIREVNQGLYIYVDTFIHIFNYFYYYSLFRIETQSELFYLNSELITRINGTFSTRLRFQFILPAFLFDFLQLAVKYSGYETRMLSKSQGRSNLVVIIFCL